MQLKSIRLIALFATFLALLVVMLGAYTRLTDAGLGCPDWPGCYGHMVLPSAQDALKKVQSLYPSIPIESHKAWTEMIHRYAAGILALFIVFIGFSVLRLRAQKKIVPWILPLFLMLLVVFQAALGMWTVTLKLLPAVVMGHLLGGMLIFACLNCFYWQLSSLMSNKTSPKWRLWIGLGAVIVFFQIALGGWVSSNYAGIACIGFPQCNGIWFPTLYLSKGFNLFSSIGANYQGGVLDNNIRVTIQFIHRVGAVVTACYILTLAVLILSYVKQTQLRRAAMVAMLLLATQFVLGVINVIYLLPLSVAVAHNGVAAMLLATLFSMFYFAKGEL